MPDAKPRPDGLFQCCGALPGGIDPAGCAYVGDAPSDGAAAKAAGMRAIGVSWGAHPRATLDSCEPPFDVVCDSVDELRAALGLEPAGFAEVPPSK